jgi:NADH:ubiquinone oxidoreductase subunit 2 (subunit N)
MRCVIALVIPIALLFCGAIARKLVRGTTWKRKDFYLGVELTLAALSSGLLYFFELVPWTPAAIPAPPADRVIATAAFVTFCLIVLMIILALHQDWEKRPPKTKGQFVRLGLLANGAGVTQMGVFSVWVKGV